MLIKGGHGEDGEMVEDTLWTGADRSMTFRHPYLEVGPVHGTGCALATAIAAGLAVGESLEVACRHGIEFVGRCLLGTVRSSDGRPVPLVIGRQPPRA
jgi:hydroxymethylpyrimidine/phosphomethylpyrimidine kinase